MLKCKALRLSRPFRTLTLLTIICVLLLGGTNGSNINNTVLLSKKIKIVSPMFNKVAVVKTRGVEIHLDGNAFLDYYSEYSKLINVERVKNKYDSLRIVFQENDTILLVNEAENMFITLNLNNGNVRIITSEGEGIHYIIKKHGRDEVGCGKGWGYYLPGDENNYFYFHHTKTCDY